MTAHRRLDAFSIKMVGDTIESAMVVLCGTVKTRSTEQPNRNIRREGRNLLLCCFIDLYDSQTYGERRSA